MTETERFKKLIKQGWEIWPCSCMCGGRFVWMEPTGHGSFRTFGCICHNEPKPSKEA